MPFLLDALFRTQTECTTKLARPSRGTALGLEGISRMVRPHEFAEPGLPSYEASDADSDDDRLLDGFEITNGFDPLTPGRSGCRWSRQPASIVEAAVTEKLERLEAKRFGKTKKPRKSLEDADTSPGVRGISAPVRRFVWARDGGRCTFENGDGRRCTARDGLHFHHDEPYGLGGGRGPENIRLLCKVHNDYMAELDYGKEKMDRYRGSPDRVREPHPTLELRPDGTVRGVANAFAASVLNGGELLSEQLVDPCLDRTPLLTATIEQQLLGSRSALAGGRRAG